MRRGAAVSPFHKTEEEEEELSALTALVRLNDLFFLVQVRVHPATEQLLKPASPGGEVYFKVSSINSRTGEVFGALSEFMITIKFKTNHSWLLVFLGIPGILKSSSQFFSDRSDLDV